MARASGILCPQCGEGESRVVDSRANPAGTQVRRRRACSNDHRYSTYEIVTASPEGVKRRMGQIKTELEQLETVVKRLREALAECPELEEV